MAAINFPDSPALNDTFVSNGVTYKWNGTKWYTFFASEADLISYSPSSPGLTATNVQDAIDEVNSSIISLTASDIEYESSSPGLTATNVQDAIDELSDAVNIDYSNTTSGLTATDVQTAIDEVSDAVNIDYSNTTSGLSATDVQGAIDEISDKIIDGDSNVTVSDGSPANISFVIDATEKGYFNASGLTVKGSISGEGNINPTATNTYDLGTSSLRWRNIYTNDLNLSNGIGDYTIVEGEEDLFLYNNKTGKVFKFALIEVDPEEAPEKVE